MEKKTGEMLQRKGLTESFYSFNGIPLNREEYIEACEKHPEIKLHKRLKHVVVYHSEDQELSFNSK